MKEKIVERLIELRKYMQENSLQAFIVVSSDAHSSEYVADHWKAREWITGFDGSAGTAVITLDGASLWTDSRYWLAAEEQLSGTGYTLMKDGDASTPSITEWLRGNLRSGDRVGVDATVCSMAEVDAWRSSLAEAGIVLDDTKEPFTKIWNNRPPVPAGEAFIMPIETAGERAADKLQRLRRGLAQKSADGMLVTMLDEVAWLTNLRGCDVEYNPVVVSYLLVTPDKATLFVGSEKINNNVKEYLCGEGIETAPYEAVWSALARYDRDTILVQPNRCNAAVRVNLNPQTTIITADSPVAAMKAVKNSVEIEGFKRAMLAEGVAMVKLLHWLRPALQSGPLTELDVDRKLTELRSEDKDFCGLSFATIAAYGKNGAIVHYEPTEESNTPLLPESFLLLDCGGQYRGGTTDITRTIALGTLTDEQCADYTRVLRGHISLAMAKFPKGTCGTQLDVLARQWLWQAGQNYLHGTGHGVGHFLNVHEGPHQIRMNNMPAPLLPGTTVTNEPGLYKAGRYGIRIENTMLVTHSCTTEFGDYCALTPLTVCPIDKTPIVPAILGAEATEYLNNYHAWVFETLSPYFEGETLEFLKQQCAPL